MRVATLKIENFRGVRDGFVRFGKHPVLVGDNNTGKTTLIEALTLLLGRDRLVRELTEHDFYGSCPQAVDRIKLVATITDFPNDDPEQSHPATSWPPNPAPNWVFDVYVDVSKPPLVTRLAACADVATVTAARMAKDALNILALPRGNHAVRNSRDPALD